MSKLLSKGVVSDATRLAERVRYAFVRGIFLFAAVLLFTADDAAAQAVPCSFPFEDPNNNPDNPQGRLDTAIFSVQRTNFCEGDGVISPTSSTRGFYIWRNRTNSGISNSSPTTEWTVTLLSGTATKGVDFTDLIGLRPGDPSWIQNTSGTSTTDFLTFEILQDTEYEGPETIRVRIQGRTSPGGTVPAGVEATFDETIELTIHDDDAPPPVADIGGGMHAVARAEALVDNQPRLAPMLRNPGAWASDFSLRASGGGVEAASGGFQAETIWGATSLSRTSDGFGDHEYLLATLGAHFRMSERLHLGGMLQFDRSGTEPGGTGESGEITGNGWMVGPYFALRDASNPLYFEGRLLYGRSSNKVDELDLASQQGGAVNATFDSERWLVQGRVEGTHDLGNGMTLIPLADFSHARDEMEAFQDANVSAQRGNRRAIAVTKLQLGADFEIPVDTADGDLMLKPGLRLVVSDSTGVGAGVNSTSPADAEADYRARVDFGVDYRLEDNLVLGFESYYSANGKSGEEEFSSYGAGLKLQFEF